MGFRCGIVGLPNVGKSTLFNALTATAAAEAAAYPFTTIEPNVGRVAVPDPRLETVARLAGSAKAVPTHLDFVDIAGLVAGASRGEGLGNKFLAHIREVDALLHVLRCFEDPDVSHVEGRVEPVTDAETVATELMLADLESLERRAQGLARRVRGGDREEAALLGLVERALALLREGRPARGLALEADDAGEAKAFAELQLLSAKPVLYVCNVDEDAAVAGNAHSARVAELAAREGAAAVVVSAAVEAEIAQLDEAEERELFLADMGLEESGLARVIRAGYTLLDLITFFTANESEAHAWTVRRGAHAAQAAGRVHSDMERGFISAETIAYDDYVAAAGEHGAREAGKMRLEGRDYPVQDGDVLRFRFNV
jgi:GTP-binding protein YchF